MHINENKKGGVHSETVTEGLLTRSCTLLLLETRYIQKKNTRLEQKVSWNFSGDKRER